MDPNPTTQRQRRVLRGFAGSTAAVVLASVAHTLGGGGAPPWWLMAGVILLSLPVTVWLVGRRSTLIGTTAVVVAAQGLLHVTFASIGSSPIGSSPWSGVAQTTHHATVGMAPTESAVAASAHSLAHLHADPTMIAAHLGAAAITIALLLHGERLVSALARGWHRIAARIHVTVHPLALPRGAPPAVCRPTIAVFLTAVSRRGPPALAR